MRKIIIGTALMLSTLTASAGDTGKVDMKQLETEMVKSASRAAILLACGSTGKKMVEDLTSSFRPTYESIDSLTPGGFDIENALDEVAAPLGCKNTVLQEIQDGYLSIEEALATASRAE